MPFTLAHPAAVLPLARTRLPFAALVIGSMTPDFPYFLLTQTRFHHFGHSAPGLLAFDVPVGLLVYVLWHRLGKAPFAALQSAPHRGRLGFFADTAAAPASYGLAAFAVLAGALTHLFWDAWTHSNGWFVQHLPALSRPLVGSLPLYTLLQYGSTVFGLVVLAFAWKQWLRSLPDKSTVIAPATRQEKTALVAALLLVAPACGGAYTAWYYRHVGGDEPLKKVLADGTEAALSAATVAFCFYAVAWRRRTSGTCHNDASPSPTNADGRE